MTERADRTEWPTIRRFALSLYDRAMATYDTHTELMEICMFELSPARTQLSGAVS